MIRQPHLWEALTPVVAAAALISSGILLYGDGAPVQILLALTCVPPALIGLRLGHRWADLEAGMIEGMSLALKASLILLVVGVVIGTWAMSGTIASMVYYGLAVLEPSYFLPAACLISALVSLAIGSSWTTAATVGVALMGIGAALGVSAPMTAGAVISGAYFGDKMSPLSDTTNLAPGVAGSELFEHIHAMLYTTLPALLIALVLYALVGLNHAPPAVDPALVHAQAAAPWLLGTLNLGPASTSAIEALRADLAAYQSVSLWRFLPAVVVIFLAVKRLPALPVLAVGALLGALMAAFNQGSGLGEILTVSYSGFTAESGVAAVDRLLSRGGMGGMLDTIAIILWATAFGGLMERAGLIDALLAALLRKIKGVGGLISATVGASIGVNFLLADQYLSIVLPGRMFRESYPRFGLQPRMLSRTLEDGGTVTSALCPWNSGGAFMATTLGVATWSYVPYAFLNLLVPLIAVTYAWSGLFILRAVATDEAPASEG
ncbi:hypothetical protein KKF91_22480 [Myxococcota bacterium]|nr:hypothetical protein [Myxococcota bacterium]MBU1433308.1 hypothetical protein [Myxococcota bacterium]MBU1899738.1 hypothetical protein [Myxococcota bacterium]